MALKFEVSEYKIGDKTVEMTFTDDNNLIYKREVNLPYIDENTIDEIYLQEIFQGQLRGMEYKIKVGVIQTYVETNQEVIE